MKGFLMIYSRTYKLSKKHPLMVNGNNTDIHNWTHVLNLRDVNAISTKWVSFMKPYNLKTQRYMWKGKKKDC